MPRTVEATLACVARRLSTLWGLVVKEANDEYGARHDPEAVTRAMNRVGDTIDARLDPTLARASKAILAGTEW